MENTAEKTDKPRKNFTDPIPEKPKQGDLYWSSTKCCFFRYNEDRCSWFNLHRPEDTYSNFGMKLLYKKDHETKKD